MNAEGIIKKCFEPGTTDGFKEIKENLAKEKENLTSAFRALCLEYQNQYDKMENFVRNLIDWFAKIDLKPVGGPFINFLRGITRFYAKSVMTANFDADHEKNMTNILHLFEIGRSTIVWDSKCGGISKERSPKYVTCTEEIDRGEFSYYLARKVYEPGYAQFVFFPPESRRSPPENEARKKFINQEKKYASFWDCAVRYIERINFKGHCSFGQGTYLFFTHRISLNDCVQDLSLTPTQSSNISNKIRDMLNFPEGPEKATTQKRIFDIFQIAYMAELFITHKNLPQIYFFRKKEIKGDIFDNPEDFDIVCDPYFFVPRSWTYIPHEEVFDSNGKICNRPFNPEPSEAEKESKNQGWMDAYFETLLEYHTLFLSSLIK